MPYDDADHARHGHLDNGRCLDGSGRDWEPVRHPADTVTIDASPAAFRAVDVFRLADRVDSLASSLLILTVAVLVLALGVVVLLVEAAQ
jgi:hypothetical protein